MGKIIVDGNGQGGKGFPRNHKRIDVRWVSRFLCWPDRYLYYNDTIRRVDWVGVTGVYGSDLWNSRNEDLKGG